MKRRRRERTDKGGSSTPGSFDSRGRVSSLFFFLLFSLSSSTSHFFFLLHRRRRSQRRRGTSHGKSKTLWEEETFFSQSREFDSLKSESSSFFFRFFFRGAHRGIYLYTKKESLTPFLLKTKNTYAIRNTRFSRQAKYSFGSVSRRPDMNVGEAMAASGNVSFRFTLRF